MKKLFLLIMLCASFYANAQYITTHAKNDFSKQTDGIYYYLPRNVLRIDIMVEQTDYHKGPLAEYAEQMLGVYDYIRTDGVSYSIKDIKISTITQPDPNLCFQVYVEDKNRDASPLNFNFTPDGVITSFGYRDDMIPADVGLKEKEEHPKEKRPHEKDLFPKKDEEVSFIKILMNPDNEDENSGLRQLTLEEQAVIAVDNINRIQQAYYDLVTGYQEVNYGNTMKFMVQKTLELKNEYECLFTGKTSKRIIKETIYITPEPGQETVNVARFSSSDGLLPVNAKKGEIIKMQFKNENNFKDVNYLTDEAIKTSNFNNKLLYRIPRNTTVDILLDNEVLASKQVKISQFGVILSCVMNKMKIKFDPNTGQIISISRE